MGIKEDFLAVTDEQGLVQPGIGQGSLNGVLYTGEAVVVLADNNALDDELKAKYRDAIHACERVTGLLWRTPSGNTDQEGPDDIHGMLAASRYLDDGEQARRFLEYGETVEAKWVPEHEDEKKRKLSRIVYLILSLGGLKKVRYVWNNHNPGSFTLSAWFGRMPGLICDMKLVAGKKPTLLMWIAWIIGRLLILREKKPATDAFTLPWMSVRATRDKGGFFSKWIVKAVNAMTMARIRKVWGSVGALILHYFNNPSHPTGLYNKE